MNLLKSNKTLFLILIFTILSISGYEMDNELYGIHPNLINTHMPSTDIFFQDIQYTKKNNSEIINESEKKEQNELAIKKKEKKILKCKDCIYTTQWDANLKRHSLIHSNEKPFVCYLCDSMFRTSTELNVHEKIHHTKQKNYKCPNCPMCFYTKSSLNRHKLVHTGEKPHACTFKDCKYTTTNMSNLKRHRMIRHYICSTCLIQYHSKKQAIDCKAVHLNK